MKYLNAGVLAALLLCFASTDLLAMAGKPNGGEIVLPNGALNAAQIERQFSGKTALANFAVKDRVEVYYFAAGGKVTELRKGWQTEGTWSVREDGRLCIDLEGERRDCRMIVKDGSQFHQYAAKRDGNHEYEQTYVAFRDGNHLKAMSPDPLLPLNTLHREEIIDLFSGKTVESETASQKRESLTYYAPDGKVEQLRDGRTRFGTWRVTGSARMCLKMEDLDEKCRIIVKEGALYKKYIVKKNGEHQHSVSYRKFLPGKQF